MTRRRSQPAKHGGETGLTLVEALVSLSILSLVLVLLPGAFKTGKRGWETAETLARRDTAETSIAVLAARLAEATPVYDKEASGRARIAFTGEPSSLMFVAPAGSGPLGAGLYRYELAAVPDQATGGTRAVLRLTPFRSERPPEVTSEERMLVPGGISIRYLMASSDGDPPEWLSSWPRDDRLPDLVELVTSVGSTPVVVALKLAPRP